MDHKKQFSNWMSWKDNELNILKLLTAQAPLPNKYYTS